MMQRFAGLLFIAAVLFCGEVLRAQGSIDEDSHLGGFMRRQAPALLFSVNQLDLEAYGGGIGVMLPGSERMQWRIAFTPDFMTDAQEWFDEDTLLSSRESSGMQLGFSVAPLWLLHSFDEVAATLSPSLGYSYHHQTWDETRYEGGQVIQVADGSLDRHYLRAGVSLGAGVALSPAIFLLGEYHLGAIYEMSSSESNPSDRFEERDRLTVSSATTLTLAVRL